MHVVVPQIPYRQALLDFATPLQAALDELGAGPGEVWFGAHIEHVMPPPDAVLFQTEVIGSPWLRRPVYLRKLERARAVWDYSPVNRAAYNARAWSHVPLRYHPALETARAERLRVVVGRGELGQLGFFGSLNQRRVDALPPETLVLPLGCFGSLRNAWLARVRCVLVPHFYPQAPVEQARIGLCLANGVPVVAEHAPDEADFPGPVYCPIGELGARARELEQTAGEQQRSVYMARANPELAAALAALR